MALRFPLGTNRGRLILSPVCSEFAIWLDEAQSDELGSLRRHGVRGLFVTYRHRGAASVRSIWMTGLMTPGAILRPVYALQLLRQIWCSGCAEIGSRRQTGLPGVAVPKIKIHSFLSCSAVRTPIDQASTLSNIQSKLCGRAGGPAHQFRAALRIHILRRSRTRHIGD